MAQVTLTTFVKTVGLAELTRLRNELEQLEIREKSLNEQKQLRTRLFQQELRPLIQSRVEAKLRADFTLTQVKAIAKERFETETLTRAFERRVAVEQEILRLKSEGVVGNQKVLRQMAEERVAAQENNILMEQRRRLLFQTAFAIFAVSINIQFMLQSLIRLAAADKEAQKSLQQLQASFTLLIGPMQLVLGLSQLLTIQNAFLQKSVVGVIRVGSVLLPLIIAFTTGSENLRRVMLAVAGAFIGINFAMTIFRARMEAAKASSIAFTTAEIFRLAVSSLGTALPLIGLAIAGALVLGELLPKPAQTQVGFGRRIETTQGHLGEDVFVGRPSAPFPMGGMGEMRVYIQIDGGQMVEAVVDKIEQYNVAGVR